MARVRLDATVVFSPNVSDPTKADVDVEFFSKEAAGVASTAVRDPQAYVQHALTQDLLIDAVAATSSEQTERRR